MSFYSEEPAEIRRHFVRQAVRVALIFAIIAAAVGFVLWWSGAAVRSGAARAADRATPSLRVTGTVRDAATHQPVAWARVSDDPSGQPPFFHGDADQYGAFELVTLAEPHRLRITAPGYAAATVHVGRAWFLWLPPCRCLSPVPNSRSPKSRRRSGWVAGSVFSGFPCRSG